MRQDIRNFRSNNRFPQKFCELVIEEDSINLEVKNSKKEKVTIPLEDFMYQVNTALQQNNREKKLPQQVP